MSEKYLPTRKSLRNQCSFSELDFNIFWKHVRSDLNDPKNIIGLEGPKKHREAWNIWAENYINDGLAAQYWGEGTERRWNLVANPEEIGSFLLLLLRHAAQANRAAIILAKAKQESIDSPSMTSSSVGGEDLFTSPAIYLENMEIPATQTRCTKRKAVSPHPSHSLQTKDSPEYLNRTIEEMAAMATPILSQGKKPRRGSSQFVKAESGNTPAPGKRARRSMGEINKTGFGSSPGLINLEPTISSEASVSPTKNPSPLARVKAKILPIPPSKLCEHVFETKIAGTNRLKLIYAAQTPTLALFIQKVYEKCTLGPQQQIRAIDVGVGNDFIGIDLEEEKDWAYITNCVVKAGARVTVVVSVV